MSDTLPALIEEMNARIGKHTAEFEAALPKGVTVAQLKQDALNSLRATPKLAQAHAPTVLGALMTCAQLGLRPGVSGLGHAWLLPFKNYRENNRLEAQLIIGYRGYVDLAYRHPAVQGVVSRIRYAKDRFKLIYGLDGDTLEHEPPADGGPRGEALLYYAIARVRGHSIITEPMSRREMEEHRDKFAMAKSRDRGIVGPWRDHFDEMARKGLAVDTPIPTVGGWSTMGDLKVGDQVFDMNGNPAAVRAVSEVKHIDCYRVTFANGASIVCDAEHYWLASIGTNASRDRATKGWAVHQIADLHAAKQAGKSVVMPVVGPLDTEPVDLPIDPWMLGYWLGNGAKDNAHVTCHADHLEEIKAAITRSGYTVGAVRPDPRSKAAGIGVRGLIRDLRSAGVLGHKHVPAAYLRASAEQRMVLLRGLIDSDGSIDAERGRVHFASVDKGLADAVAELARSLGEVVNRSERDAVGYGKTVRAYTVQWRPSVCPATISAKAGRFRARTLRPYRSVKSIQPIPSVPTRCIEVDCETSTYAAGIEMVPTHNTMIRARLVKAIPTALDLAIGMSVDEGVRLDFDPTANPAEVTTHPDRADEADAENPAQSVRESVTIRESFPSGGLTGDQDREIAGLVRDRRMSKEQALDLVERLFKERKSARQLSEEQAAELIEELKKIPLPTMEGEVFPPSRSLAEPDQPAPVKRKPTKAMMNMIHAALAERDITDDEAVRAELGRILGVTVESRKELTFDQASQILDRLEAPADAAAPVPPAPGSDELTPEQIRELIRAEWAEAGGQPQALAGAFRKAMNVGAREAAPNELNAFLQQLRDGKHLPRQQERKRFLGSIAALFDGLDKPIPEEDRLRDLSALLGYTVLRPHQIAFDHLQDVIDVLTACKGQTHAWDEALQAAQAARGEQPAS
ncbi:recombinase RecT [Nonomuraea sp. NPDC001636]|uniref:recombinase RecT n=1 Tax=Nonomuraea sp. NPDC001636 TaxID=3154391 RepID=UPI00331D85F3